MRSGSRVDAVFANPVRSGRKQPQRFFCGSPGSYFAAARSFGGVSKYKIPL